MKTLDFNELLGVVLALAFIAALVFGRLDGALRDAFVVLLTLIVQFFFRKQKSK